MQQNGLALSGGAARPVDGPWTVDLIQTRIEEMGDVCRRLGMTARDKPSKRLSMPLEVVRSFSEAYGYSEAEAPVIRPSAAEIGRFEETSRWVHSLSPTDRTICWGIALGRPLRKISARLGRMPGCVALGKSVLPARYRRACLLLAYNRNAAGVPVDHRTQVETEARKDFIKATGRTGQETGIFLLD